MPFINQPPAPILALAILTCAFPTALRADLSENTILQAGSALNLDTGAVVSSGIAPSSIFVVKGSGLADPGIPVLQDTQAPGGLPSTLNGASITVVVSGVTTHPALYYTSPTQLAAVLPAATPVGTGILTVSYRGNTSAPAPIQVVPSALGINTYGVNTGVATNAASGALITLN